MPLVTITNLTTSRIGLNQYMSPLDGQESRTYDLKIQEMEDSQPLLATLVNKGHISFSVTQDTETADDPLEPVLGGSISIGEDVTIGADATVGASVSIADGVRIATGAADPNTAVTGAIGDLFINTTAGTLYINDDGATSWALVTTT